MSKTPKEALAATIADFKATPGLRCKTDFAQNAHGRPVSPFSPDAKCFCAIGRYVFHRGAEAAPEGRFNDTVRDELPITFARDVWGPNDYDNTEDGRENLANLERILAKMPEAPA